MAMTKKHYEMVASTIRQQRAIALNWNGEGAAQDCRLVHASTEAIARVMAVKFADDNPMFDRERFLKACGVES